MYTKLESQFWKDEKMIKLSGDARYLMLYLLTSPHRNILCCYFLPEPYACFDLGFSMEQFSAALDALIATGRIEYDKENHVVFIPNYLKYNPLENPNQVKSAIDKLGELPQTPLLKHLLSVLETINKPFLEPLIKQLQERFPQPVSSNQYTVSNNSNQESNSFVPTEVETTIEEPANSEAPKEQPKRKYHFDSEHMELAERLKFRILEHKPDAKIPSILEQWANTIRLMVEQDHRASDRIAAVIDWCQKDTFWQQNILSADKLRAKFDQLELKMQSKTQSKTGKRQGPNFANCNDRIMRVVEKMQVGGD